MEECPKLSSYSCPRHLKRDKHIPVGMEAAGYGNHCRRNGSCAGLDGAVSGGVGPEIMAEIRELGMHFWPHTAAARSAISAPPTLHLSDSAPGRPPPQSLKPNPRTANGYPCVSGAAGSLKTIPRRQDKWIYHRLSC